MIEIKLGSNVSLEYDEDTVVHKINIKNLSFVPIDKSIAHEILKTEKCLYYLYFILDETTNKFYIGKQSINRPSLKKRIDTYFGSGIIIRRMYKSGKHKLIKYILKCCKDKFILSDLEAKVVDDELRTNEYCLNLCNGGIGGRTLTSDGYIKNGEKHRKWFIEHKDKEEIRIKKLKEYLNSEIGKKRLKESIKKYYDTHPEIKEYLRQKALNQFADPIRKKKMINGLKQFYANNEEAKSKMRERRLAYNKTHIKEEHERMKKLNEYMKQHPEKRITNARKVLMFSKNNEFIKKFDSIGLASKYIIELEKSTTKIETIIAQIHKVITGKRKYCHNYIWKYET